ncbi:Fungalysin metallopeptidase-domain-containing protein [Glomus cerebriforme]|uniref:Extracellular metalloproteinase n=1 Tax=Glomus cerebriforme TaxID=658196 RepID=A0A397SF35_9GLOM|nr:Fungalysin metallopeptidase-domain-containing protein [Glomus cerebriforme]
MKATTLALVLALLSLATSGYSNAHAINNKKTSSTSNISRSKGNFGPELAHRSYVVPNSLHSTKSSIDALTTPNEELSAQEIAIKFVKESLHPYSDFKIKNIYKSEHNGITHVYIRQVVNGLEVVNGDLNVNIDKFGRVISYGDSFVSPPSLGHKKCSDFSSQPEEESIFINNGKYFIASNSRQVYISSRPLDFLKQGKKNVNKNFNKHNTVKYKINDDAGNVISPFEALNSLSSFINQQSVKPEKLQYYESFDDDQGYLIVENVPFALSPVKLAQNYIQLDDMSLQLVWDLQIEMENNWYHAHINANTGEIIALMDWVADAAYNVFPLGVNDPSDGERDLVLDPYDVIASPYGWHSQGDENFTTTIGNNVYAHENLQGRWEWENNYRPEGGKILIFDFPLDLSDPPKSYLDTSITNLFYWNNMVHDLFYRYGFNEVAGNFQQNNHGKGGKEGDPVIANAQDGSGFNNANFATPPDGQHGKMRMYVWDVSNPWRDGDLESGIVIHEYAHGISTRLTGGPANSGCLGWGESGGMGEGWGDFFATILRMRPEYNSTKEFGMGNWANGGVGIRNYNYSTSLKSNPETYIFIDKPDYWGVHAKGAVWAEMLYEVYWILVGKYGFTLEWFPPTVGHDSYEWYTTKTSDGLNELKYPKHGNTLTLQLVVDGMKLQPCRPTFIDARNAIIQADEILTNGENKCDIWSGFAKRGLGVGAKVIGNNPWGGLHRENFEVPEDCEF